jgi:sensor histidine kinase YesM
MAFFSQKKWVSHLAFWLVIYTIYIIQQLFSEVEGIAINPLSFEIAIKSFFRLLAVAATSYMICFEVLPLFLDKKQILTGFSQLLVWLYSIAVLHRLMVIYVLEPLLGRNTYQESILEILTQFPILIRHYIITNLFEALPFIIFHLLLDRQVILQKRIEAEAQKKEAELAALKSKLNPHFLFNTLNNIYSLAEQKSSQTAVCIEKLANILDYLLYKCNEKKTALENEIALLTSYFELQSIRYGGRLLLKANYKTDRPYQIAPLLLLPIVENIFKHGVEQNIGQSEVTVSLTVFENKLCFYTENCYSPNKNTKTGIGLSSLKNQLDLLYPGNYSFKIKETEKTFITHLEIMLDENKMFNC